MLRRNYKHQRDEVMEDWRKENNEELYNLYSSPRIIGLIIPRRMRWEGRALCMRRR
jgi:hypothetical protein